MGGELGSGLDLDPDPWKIFIDPDPDLQHWYTRSQGPHIGTQSGPVPPQT